MTSEFTRCFASTPDHAFGIHRNLIMDVWRRETTLEAIHDLGRNLSDLGLTHRQDMLLLTLVEESAAPPSPAARQATAEHLRRSAGMICRAATVLEGDGFRAATIRSIAIGLNLVARQPFPHKVFSSVTESAEWLASGNANQMKPDEIVAALERIRSWEVGCE